MSVLIKRPDLCWPCLCFHLAIEIVNRAYQLSKEGVLKAGAQSRRQMPETLIQSRILYDARLNQYL
ncbi:MAG: hypothetical protein V3V09_09220 [Arenicellales bacterium]